MRIEAPDPRPREAGDYATWFHIGYGNPTGTILLDEAQTLRLENINADDCDRLIKAVAEIKSRILAQRPRMAALHGRGNVHKGTCQLCGLPEDDALHAEPKPLVISDSTIAQARYLAEHPDDFTADPHHDAAAEQAAGDDSAADAQERADAVRSVRRSQAATSW